MSRKRSLYRLVFPILIIALLASAFPIGMPEAEASPATIHVPGDIGQVSNEGAGGAMSAASDFSRLSSQGLGNAMVAAAWDHAVGLRSDGTVMAAGPEVVLSEWDLIEEYTYYVPDDYSSIQAAVDAASSGDTIIIRNGTYTENVDVNKDHLTIQSENGAEVTIVEAPNPDDHVFEVIADYVNISGFTAKGATGNQKAGIYLSNTNGCNVSNNSVLDNCSGIYLNWSNNNMIINNRASDNWYDESTFSYGIELYHSWSNVITNNSCAGSMFGVHISWSSNNMLIANIVLNNNNGIAIWDSSDNTISANTVESNGSGIVIITQAGGGAYHNTVSDNVISSNSHGISLLAFANFHVDNNTVKNNTVFNNEVGMFIRGTYCKDNLIYVNSFISNINNVDAGATTNNWNSPSPSTYIYNSSTYTNYLGNYWSDYPGSDVDGDGIGDSPYPIDGDNDNYPLWEPFENYGIGLAPWPMFQHDAQHTGRSPFAGPGISENPQVQVFIEGEGSDLFYPVVIDSSGVVYLEARFNDKSGVYAFYPNGTEKWYYEIPPLPSSSSLMLFTPIIGPDGAIYVLVPADRAIIAINPDGSLKWETIFTDLLLQSLVVGDSGTIYSLAGSTAGISLIALDSTSGNTLWMYELDYLGGGWSAPAIGPHGTIYFGYQDTLYALNSDGTEKWQKEFTPDCQYFACQPEVLIPSIGDDGAIYVMVRQERDFWALQDAGMLPCLHAINPENPNEEEWPAKCNKFFGRGPLTISPAGNLYLTGAYEWITLLFGFDSQGNDLENWPITGIGRGGLLIVDKEEIIYGLFGSPYSTLKAFDQSGEEKWALPLSILQWDGHISLGGDGTIYGAGKQKIYTIISGLDTTPPTVSSVSPEDGTTYVAVDAVITATFSEPMDSSTLTTESFTLAGSAVSGTVSYDSDTYTATFTPNGNLGYEHTYTATLSTDITDEAGNPLEESYSWSFSTKSAPTGAITVIGEYKGVPAYSNGENTGTPTGKWQCVEYVKRFYDRAMQMNTRSWYGNANDYYENASQFGLLAYPNSGSHGPKQDDILCFEGGEYGHVAIIMEAGSDYMKIIDQNRHETNAYAKLDYDKDTNTITIPSGIGLGASYSVRGWLRKPLLPVASFTQPSNPVIGEEITFDASASYDQDGGPIDNPNGIVSYYWDFDGEPDNGVKVSHKFTEAKTYTVTLIVTDDEGQTRGQYKEVTVKKPPVILVHGFQAWDDYDPDEIWSTMKDSLTADGFKVYVSHYANDAVTCLPLQTYAQFLGQEIEQIKQNEGVSKVDIVAHSMGGLVSRYYIDTCGGYKNVRNLIMLETPNNGFLYDGFSGVLADALLTMVLAGVHPGVKDIVDDVNSFIDKIPWLGEQAKTERKLLLYNCYIYSNLGMAIEVRNWESVAGIKAGLTYLGSDVQYMNIVGWLNILPLAYDCFVLDGVNTETVNGMHGDLPKSEEVIQKVKNILTDGATAYEMYDVEFKEAQDNNVVQVVPPISSTAFGNESELHMISLGNTTSVVDFNLLWSDGDLDLTLTTPSDVLVDPISAQSNPNIEYYDDPNLAIAGYAVNNTEPGIWTVNVTAVNIPVEGEDYTVMTFLETMVTLSLNLSKYQYDSSEGILIKSELMNGNTSITDALVTANVTRPDESTEAIILYDDGLHNDEAADDGIYADLYTNTSLWGPYDINVIALGTIDNQEFAREGFTTVWVKRYPDLTLSSSDISFSNDAPMEGEEITIDAIIRNVGDADAGNATVEFYDGALEAASLISEDTLDVPQGGNATASVSWNATFGAHDIYAVISPYNEFLEKDYSNNQGNTSIYVINPEIISCDGWGTPRDQFVSGQGVYVKGSGLEANTRYKIWIQDEPVNEGDALLGSEDPSLEQNLVTTDDGGNFSPVQIWFIPQDAELVNAKYDIVADKQNDGEQNGTYNDTSDGIDSASIEGIIVDNIWVTWGSHDTPPCMVPEGAYNVSVDITNSGNLTWPSDGDNPVQLSYHWYSGDDLVLWDGLRTQLPADVPLGGNVTLNATVDAPLEAGSYTLKWDMVYEGITWFSLVGCSTLDVAVTVDSKPAVTTIGATNVTANSATLNGSLDCLGNTSSVDVSFEWGKTIAYGSETVPRTMTAPGPFSGNITDLDPCSTYHFRARAVGNGTAYGEDNIFSTNCAVTAETSIASNLHGDGVAAIDTTIVRVKDAATGETVLGISIGSYEARALYDPAGIEMLSVRPGDPPFNAPVFSINNSAGYTAFNQSTVAGIEPPICVANLVPRLVGCSTDSYQLEVTFDLIADPDGNLIPQDEPAYEVFRRGNAKADGDVNIADALFIAQYLVGSRDLGDGIDKVNPVNAASVKHDNSGDEINISDVLFICQYLVGQRDECFNMIPIP